MAFGIHARMFCVLAALATASGAALADPSAPLAQPHWTKFCGKDPGERKSTCMTTAEARLSGASFVASLAVIEPEGAAKKLFRVSMPHGLRVVSGARAHVDQGWPQFGQFVVCLANGCFADFEVKEDFIGDMKKGTTLWLQALDLNGQWTSYPVRLENFAKASEGPPTDPKVFAADRQKLQEQARAEATGSIPPARK